MPHPKPSTFFQGPAQGPAPTDTPNPFSEVFITLIKPETHHLPCAILKFPVGETFLYLDALEGRKSIRDPPQGWRPGCSGPALGLTASPLPHPHPEVYEQGWEHQGQACLSFIDSLTAVAAGCWLSLWRDIYSFFFVFAS